MVSSKATVPFYKSRSRALFAVQVAAELSGHNHLWTSELEHIHTDRNGLHLNTLLHPGVNLGCISFQLKKLGINLFLRV